MKLFLTIFFAVALSGCRYSSEAKTLDHLFTKEVNVSVSKLSIFTNNMPLNAASMLALDKYLIIQVTQQPKILYVFDLEKNKYSYNLFNYGRGHKEMLNPTSIDIHDKGLMLSVNQTIIVIDSLYKKCDKGEWKIINLDPGASFKRITKLSDDYYIANGLLTDSKKQFVVLNKDFNVLQYFDDYPYKNIDNYNIDDLVIATQGKLVSCDNKFAFASSYGRILKFFELDNSEVVKKKEYIFEVPKLDSRTIGSATITVVNENTFVGAMAGTSSKDTYFFLYGIGTYRDRVRGGNIIYCFDHDGQPKHKIILDVKLKQITYSEKYNCLLGAGEDENGEYQIYKISL